MPKILILFLKVAAAGALLVFIAGVGLVFYYTYNLPRPEKFTESPFIQSTKIYDRTGKTLLYNIYGEEKRDIVSFDKISDNIKNAVVAVEDARFYQHAGFDLEGIARAILSDFKLMSTSQGGSTITQQLIRSVYLGTQKTLARKVRELVLSVELEKKYSKNQILNWYLNKIPFGENAYGVEAASQAYFNKSSDSVSAAEAAALAALIQRPSYYSPYGINKEKLLARKDLVLLKMKEQGYLDNEQFEIAKNEKIVFSDQANRNIKAPHFVMYVKKYLEDKYGEDYLKEKGLKVYTSIDWELQQFAEKTISDFDATLRGRGANNAALVAQDPKTGEILALVGSKNFFGESYPQGCEDLPGSQCLFSPKFDVATMGLRQPGSAFKPFVYATGLKMGYTPETVLWDVKTEFNPNCDPSGNAVTDPYGLRCYNPQDYDGNVRGQMPVKKALAGSLNIPAVKMLYLTGLKNSLQTARDFGITTLNEPDRYGLSLVLGGGEVNLLEMAGAYGVFATEGNYVPPVSIIRIEDSQGNIVEQNNKQPTRVLDTQVARQINNILSDNSNRAFIFGENNPLHFNDFEAAAKTGTTQFLNDGWTMGYSPFAVVGVWVGNNDNSSTKDLGVGLAAPIWNKVMGKILSSHPVENFTIPEPSEPSSPALAGSLPSDDFHTILYYVNKENPLGPPPQNPTSDPAYALWQIGINNYLISKLGQLPQQENSPSQ